MKLAFLCVAAVLAAASVQAQNMPPPSESGHQPSSQMQSVEQACQDDMQSLCQGKTGKEAMSCLRSNSAKVSSGCKTAMQHMSKEHAEKHQ